MDQYYVYFLREVGGKRTYVGYTVNLERRLRQHNGELVGGAKSTRGRKWEFAGYLTGFLNSVSALQCEWKLKHPYGIRRKTFGMEGRMESLKYIFSLEKLTSNSIEKNVDLVLKLYLLQEYLPIELPSNIEVIKIE